MHAGHEDGYGEAELRFIYRPFAHCGTFPAEYVKICSKLPGKLQAGSVPHEVELAAV